MTEQQGEAARTTSPPAAPIHPPESPPGEPRPPAPPEPAEPAPTAQTPSEHQHQDQTPPATLPTTTDSPPTQAEQPPTDLPTKDPEAEKPTHQAITRRYPTRSDHHREGRPTQGPNRQDCQAMKGQREDVEFASRQVRHRCPSPAAPGRFQAPESRRVLAHRPRVWRLAGRQCLFQAFGYRQVSSKCPVRHRSIGRGSVVDLAALHRYLVPARTRCRSPLAREEIASSRRPASEHHWSWECGGGVSGRGMPGQ